jgi:hypothetical protein
MTSLFAMPLFLRGRIEQQAYSRWLARKVDAHVKRDRKRSVHSITGSEYRKLIHRAVCASNGDDFYTGEPLDWEKLSSYCNDDSKAARSSYKAGFALLPTVDHVLREDGRYDFVICAWRTNDAKSDLCHSDFLALCRRVVMHDQSRGNASSPAFKMAS